ncbi:hypothetical protein CGCF415_v013382 [Colletotrichum fructicola]|nr:hypothetical protein CGCF415_v013382 [Colletotrichum fructicola]KAF4903253.1 hypothetical protein CGCFRS4_v001848 [Colletotrichum fructicola]KAF4937576.1 hypothetical protein CGCF245_v005485 [Colletotrichum fructicola]
MQIFLGSWFIWFSILIPRDPKSSFAAKAARTLRRLRRRYLKQSHLREEGRTEYWLAILRNCRFSEVLFSTLVEFQEAQVFFTLAVQLASISMLVLNESISAKRIDWVAAKLFQAGNTFVVLLVQAEQQRQRMHWWYTYLLTLIVCVFFVAIQRIGLESEFIGSEELPECSFKLPSILKTCDYGVGVYIPTFQEAAMEDSSDFSLSIVLISLSFITLDQVAQTPRLRNWGVDVWQSTSKAVKWMTKFGSVVWSLLWLVMNCSLASLLLSTTDTILREVGGSLSEKDNWTFGQIVAVLLWAPVVFKYIYLNICEWKLYTVKWTRVMLISEVGVKRGFDSRLDSHYEVVLSSERPQLPPRPSQQSTDGIPLTSTGYKNVPNNEDGREYVGLEDPRTPKWGRQYSASSRDGASSVGITEPQSFPWSNSR